MESSVLGDTKMETLRRLIFHRVELVKLSSQSVHFTFLNLHIVEK